MLVAPGLVDMHVHGGGGYEVNCATAGEVELSVRKMARFHARHGTTALVATTVSDSLHPAEVLGESRKGRLGPGADADIVVLDRDFSVVCTIVGVRSPTTRLGCCACWPPQPGRCRCRDRRARP